MKNSTNGGEFPLPFTLVPWGHHVEIITKCKSIEEAFFYDGQTIEKGLEYYKNNQYAISFAT